VFRLRDSNHARFAIGMVFAGLFLWLALREVNLGALWQTLATAQYWLMIPFVICLFGFYWLKALRWRRLIGDDYDRSARDLAGPMMIGFAANNVLPLRAGEIIRVYVAGERLGIPKAHLLATLVVERFFDLLAVALLFSLGLILATTELGDSGNGPQLLIGVGIALSVAVGALLGLRLFAKSSNLRITGWIPKRFRDRIDKHVQKFIDGLKVLLSGGRLWPVLVNSLLQWSILTLCIFMALLAVGIDSEYGVGLVLLGILVLGISLPGSPGFIGTIEYSFVLGLGFFGVPPETALAASLFYHGITYALVTLSGACFLLLSRRTNRAVRREI